MLRTQLLHKHRPMSHRTVGSATFAVEINESTGVMEIAMSVCSPNDQFSRKFGRDAATSRLKSRKNTVVGYNHESVPFSVSVELALMDYLKRNEIGPETEMTRLVSKALDSFKQPVNW